MTIHVHQTVSPEACPALVLNADYRPLSYYPLSLWSWQDAIKAVFLDRVNIVSFYDFLRDRFTCQYCGEREELTFDHVIPRSKGGQTTWENVVAACSPCNLRKRDRLPHEAGMPLQKTPRAPHPDVYLTLGTRSIPRSWHPYLPARAREAEEEDARLSLAA